ncbi:hypothetical protein TSOC_006410 [Tetrabaena socialis]|uniref:EGF-like domain-containing protein n=1 Tax=Tetrabaena socialis TaxID=47790 RepID=A0A2J8A3S6_9CHLO|nr:hypothetical protein TSOC_006410 [Tetrabaena socialis]|eukprot:PNH07164.1 hypothetical protein TSOC_006410 [Tetrabaena socialis]
MLQTLSVILLLCTSALSSASCRGESQEHLTIPPGLKYELGEPVLVGQAATGQQSDTTAERVRPRLADQEPIEADGGVNSDAAVRRRCAGVRGTWCGEFFRQAQVATKPVPRGSTECPGACSGWGNCNHDTGRCACPAGRGGPDCGQEVKRPCTHRYRRPDEHNLSLPMGHINPDGSDIDVRKPGWVASRCFGHCWDDVAACFCGEDSKFRRIPAPPGSPPWTPPLQWGRPLADGCQPSKVDRDGQLTFVARVGGTTKYENIYGPEGWCNKVEAETRCCHLEMAWPCDGSTPMETTCANQCGGHGDCFFGFCRCHPDWYGQDCSRKKAGSDMEPGMHEQGQGRPWLAAATVTPPAALPVPALPTRPRPLIYVYDVPPDFTFRMLQYRLIPHVCTWRRWFDYNVTDTVPWTYGVETLLHEVMLQSEHRTFDPEEADFFYGKRGRAVPMYITCYFWPIMGWADSPWWHAPFAGERACGRARAGREGVRVMDGVHAVFESILDWDAFSLRIRESALEAVPQILEAVTPERLARMQRQLARVWHRCVPEWFAYTSHPLLRARIDERYRIQGGRLAGSGIQVPPEHPFRPLPRFPSWNDDAFGTIMQWLYHRIADTR